MKRLMVVLIFSTVITSCNSDDNLNLKNKDLVGEWAWKSTDGGIAFHIHENPTTTGKNIQLYLTSDNKYAIIENNAEVSKGSYYVSMKKSIYSGELSRFITISGNYKNQNLVLEGIITVDEINLHIDDNNFDGIGSSFEKVARIILLDD